MILKYKKNLKDKAIKLRNNSTFCEVLVWRRLKNNKFLGYKFIRQKRIASFIVDFYCKELNLAIEIDGKIHENQKERDYQRENIIKKYGINFIRISNDDIQRNLDKVISSLIKNIFPSREGWHLSEMTGCVNS